MDIDWKSVRRVLVIRLRSIGDTVLSTPSLIALRRFHPDAQIDILLEDWVAPLLDGFDAVASQVSHAAQSLHPRRDRLIGVGGGPDGAEVRKRGNRGTKRHGFLALEADSNSSLLPPPS